MTLSTSPTDIRVDLFDAVDQLASMGAGALVLSVACSHPVAEALIGFLPATERARADRIRKRQDRSCFVIARATARAALGRWRGAEPGGLDLTLTARGQPQLRGGPPFSISHSGERVMVGLSKAGSIGVDIEQVRAIEDIDSLGASCLTSDERAVVSEVPAKDRSERFLQFWTKKEAITKAMGVGMAYGMRNLSLSASGALQGAISTAEGVWHYRSLSTPSGYVSAIAADRGLDPVMLLQMNSDHILQCIRRA